MRGLADRCFGSCDPGPPADLAGITREYRRRLGRLVEVVVRVHRTDTAHVDPEMQVRRSRAGVAGVSHEPQRITRLHVRPPCHGLSVEVGVVQVAPVPVAQPHDVASPSAATHPRPA